MQCLSTLLYHLAPTAQLFRIRGCAGCRWTSQERRDREMDQGAQLGKVLMGLAFPREVG